MVVTGAPMVRVVVVNFDGGAMTQRCLDALLATEHPADRLEIVVVDNASLDGLLWVLAERYPTVRVIESDVNEGFARGCNLAMSDLEGIDYLALVNNDAIVEPGWLAPLLETCAPAGVGAACPKLLLNLWARTVFIEAPVVHSLDDRVVGVGVSGVRMDGVDVRHEVRFDERFWPPWSATGRSAAARWTKQPVASMWWSPEHISVGDVTEVDLEIVASASTTVRVGDPPTTRVDVAPTMVARPAGRNAAGRNAAGRNGAGANEPGTAVTVPVGPLRRIVNSAGGQLYHGWHGGDRGFLEPDIGQYDTPAEVFSWCGGAVVLKADYLREVGIFDPTFFLYYEDFDLSWRGRAAGWTYRYDPRSVVLHEHAYSSKAGSEFFNFWVDRNRRLTLVKNAPWPVAVRAVAGSLLSFARDIAQHLRSRWQQRRPPSPRWTRARCVALLRVWGGVPSAVRERRRIDRTRVVDRSAIESWMVTK